MDDVRSVLDAVGAERSILLGAWEGGQMCALFAATFPERTSALVLFNTEASTAMAPEDQRRVLRDVREGWGSRRFLENFLEAQLPGMADDEDFAAGS